MGLFVLFLVATAAVIRASPIADYVFSQQGCKDALWEFDDGLNFTRNVTQTACPQQDGFEYWTTGAYTTGSRVMDGIVSSLITDQFEELTSDNPSETPRNITLVLWFTLTQLPSLGINDLLVEFSPSQPGTEISSTDVGPESYQPKVQLRTGRSQWVFPTYNLASVEGPYTSVNLAGGGYSEQLTTGAYMILTSSESTLTDSIRQTIVAYSCNGRDAAPVLAGYGNSPDLPDNQYLQLLLDPNNRIRMGSSRYPSSSSNYIGSTNTWFHRFAVWNRSLTETEISDLAQYGIPFAIAAAKNTTFELNQDETISVNLNTTDSVADYDGDTITVIRVLTLPTSGVLVYDGEEVTDLPFEMTDASLLEYQPVEGEWVLTCDLGPSFQFDCSDNGVDFSVAESYAIMCIRETPPTVVSANYSVPEGYFVRFSVNVTGSTGPLLNATTVLWQVLESPLFLTDCSTPVVTNVFYTGSLEYCFLSTQPTGQETFLLIANNGVLNSTSQGVIGITNLIPVQAYDQTTSTLEYPNSVNFSLNTFDGLDRTPLWGVLQSLPSHGTVTFASNASAVNIGDLVDGPLTYTGDPFYFNRYVYTDEPYADPDTFTFKTRYATETSTSVGVVSVDVTNVFNPEFSVSGLTGVIPISEGETYTFGTRIQITDPDGDEYFLAVYVITQYGTVVFTVGDSDLVASSELILGTCGAQMNSGCTEVAFAARSSRLNRLLGNMTLVLDTDSAASARFTIKFYKPSPGGITQGNFASTLSNAVPYVYANIPLDIIVVPTASPVVPPGDSTLANLLIASLVITGIGAFFIFATVLWFICRFWSRIWAALKTLFSLLRFGFKTLIHIGNRVRSLSTASTASAASVPAVTPMTPAETTAKPVVEQPLGAATVATASTTTVSGLRGRIRRRRQQPLYSVLEEDEEEYMYE
jgi:hypothetical protein